MAATCVNCGKTIETGDYRLIGIEQGTWASRYAHLGNCEDEARRRFAPKKVARKRAVKRAAPLEVEELTLDSPDPFPDEELSWFAVERRR
ncbi:MAG: hypothetical protein ACRDIB_12055 [Ardenticatenaceae bacterium]